MPKPLCPLCLKTPFAKSFDAVRLVYKCNGCLGEYTQEQWDSQSLSTKERVA